MIRLSLVRRAATAAEAALALGRLDQSPGMYFGVDAGIQGLHPLQATLVDKPALSLAVLGNGLRVQACSGLGRSLLDLPALKDWAAASAPNAGRHAIVSLRWLMGLFEPLPELMLQGALGFNAHRLAPAAVPSTDPVGTLFLAEGFWQRDGQGQWTQVTLSLPGSACDDMGSALAPAKRLSLAHEPRDDHAPGGYADMVTRALGYLHEQALVSLTLSQSYRRRMPEQSSVVQAFARLCDVNPAPVTFFLNDGAGGRLFGASPDLQLVVQRGDVESFPVCGTVAREPDPVGEAQSCRALLNEEVDAASLAICSDALRNDLAPLCQPGTLRLTDRQRLMSMATVVHTVDRLAGRLRPGVDAWDALVATAAPAMVTGTPRQLAIKAIEQLEASPRGWYGGLAVQVNGCGDALVGTILRAAAIRDGVVEVRTGGDLLADSSPPREEQESRLKAISLWRALGFEVAQNPVAEAVAAWALPAVISLQVEADPFPESLRDTLLGLGLGIEPGAVPSVVAGKVAPSEISVMVNTVAIGDAAFQMLAQAGFNVVPVVPEHGRLLRCTVTAQAPWRQASSFVAGRYAGFSLHAQPQPQAQPQTQPQTQPDWQVWVIDASGNPLVLASTRRRVVCILFRPDSLLSGLQARQVLAAALTYCA